MASHFSDNDPLQIPPELRPLGAWAYFGLSILFSIPIVGLIFLIIFSFSDANINRRNFARSYFIGALVAVILVAVAFFTGVLEQTITAVQNNELPDYVYLLPWL